MRSLTRTRRRGAAVLTAVVLGTAGLVALPGPAGAACPTLPSGDTHWLGALTIGASGSNWTEVTVHNVGGTVTADLVSINGSPAPPTNSVVTITCNTYSGTLTGLGPTIHFSATIADNGNEIYGGQWSNGSIGGQYTAARVLDHEDTVGTALTTDPGNTGATPAEPVQVGITAPASGSLQIDVGTSAMPVVAGYQLLNQVVHISAPTASAADPLVFTFVLDSSVVAGTPLAQLEVFRNGVRVLDCSPGAGTAAIPDPCVAGAIALPGGDVQFTVRTSAASSWTFGAASSLFGLRLLNAGLPRATLGQPYSATLFASGGTEPYKFRKLTKLPKGLKLAAKTGAISGTPKKVGGTFTVRLQVLDKAKPKHSATKTFTLVVG